MVDYTEQTCDLCPDISKNNEEVFSDNASKLVALKLRARGFTPCLRNAIEGITEETPVSEIILADWQIHHWNSSGRVTLIGDAAHPMVMCKNPLLYHFTKEKLTIFRSR